MAEETEQLVSLLYTNATIKLKNHKINAILLVWIAVTRTQRSTKRGHQPGSPIPDCSGRLIRPLQSQILCYPVGPGNTSPPVLSAVRLHQNQCQSCSSNRNPGFQWICFLQ